MRLRLIHILRVHLDTHHLPLRLSRSPHSPRTQLFTPFSPGEPPHQLPLYITINICALTSNTSILPTVLVSTASPPSWTLGTRTSPDSGSGGTSEGGWNLKSRSGNLWEMTLDEGFGNWTWTGDPVGTSLMFGLGLLADGTTQSVSASGNVAIQLGVSSSGPIHSITTSQPFLGDTTNSTALIFSPLLQDSPHYQPTYPNYTLPPAQLVLPSFSSSTDNMVSNASFIGPAPNLTLIMVPTGSSPTQDGLDHSLCAIRAANSSTGSVASPSNMIVNRTEPSWVAVDGEEGYRQYWVVGNLVSGSNYTAWVYDEDKQSLSPPIWLATKDASFQCPLVLPNSMCPSVAYAAPFDVNATSSTSPLTSLPDNITSILTSSLQSFSTSLLSQACGRDYYSHVSTCADCYAAYRDWLCRVLVPRCADAVSSTTADPPAATVSRTAANPRDPGIYTPSYDYVELLPCLSVCNAADRTCPTSLQFRCPVRGVTANSSYGFVGNNADSGDGAKDTGWPAADQWGNRWCNG
ncbi:stretch-activated cation channel mid1 [Saitozyma podzolica]|uniref:Stretch-activated cation channel mid1 n=1 Tax=Saitozyma podzolica TaxID=1890683 RepID=A0A427YJQ7_9TREE|nr:stretch-activated cation channel mid1 [Saitozyma podzolica]